MVSRMQTNYMKFDTLKLLNSCSTTPCPHYVVGGRCWLTRAIISVNTACAAVSYFLSS